MTLGWDARPDVDSDCSCIRCVDYMTNYFCVCIEIATCDCIAVVECSGSGGLGTGRLGWRIEREHRRSSGSSATGFDQLGSMTCAEHIVYCEVCSVECVVCK